jgi:hypothetical protein
VLALPPTGACNADVPVQGVDCSGLVHLAAANAGLFIPVGTASLQSQPDTWNATIPPSWGLEMQSVGNGRGTVQEGDIISWGSHIGIVAKSGTQFVVCQSNGRSDPITVCAPNRNPQKRGPRCIPVAQALRWFGRDPDQLRLVCTATADGSCDANLVVKSNNMTSEFVLAITLDGASFAMPDLQPLAQVALPFSTVAAGTHTLVVRDVSSQSQTGLAGYTLTLPAGSTFDDGSSAKNDLLNYTTKRSATYVFTRSGG